MLTDEQLERYSRQLLVPEIDLAGQEALRQSRILIIGCGGLGNPAALYLAGAGVGRLVLADPDHVEMSNLHRQTAFRSSDVGRQKVLALADQLGQLNDDVVVQAEQCYADADWLDKQVEHADVVLDCSDNFATRQAVNRACVVHGVPLVSGAAITMDGQLSVFDRRQADSPCYACLYGVETDGDMPCSRAGIAGPVVGVIGTLQAMAAMAILCGQSLPSRLQTFDGRTLQWQEYLIKPDPKCPVCAASPTVTD